MQTAQRLPRTQDIPTTNPEVSKAYLARGEVAEAEEKWELALEQYGIGLSLLPTDSKTAYFLFSNAGHCLNALELFCEGESYCLRAIEIDGTRPDAYRNLAVSRHGQGNLKGSALCLVEAIKTNPADYRTVQLLKQLLTDHPTLSLQCSWIARELGLIEQK